MVETWLSVILAIILEVKVISPDIIGEYGSRHARRRVEPSFGILVVLGPPLHALVEGRWCTKQFNIPYSLLMYAKALDDAKRYYLSEVNDSPRLCVQ